MDYSPPIRQVLDTALSHITDYDRAASTLGQAIAVQETFMCLSAAKRDMKPVAWRVAFYPGNWKLYEYDPTGLPGILEIRPLYE